MANNNLAQIESKALRMVGLSDENRKIEEEKELIKESLAPLMEEEGMTEYRAALDEHYDAKITAGTHASWKLDEEGLADHLDMAISAVKDKEVLIKAVEDGRLTLDRYKSFFYRHVETKVSVRRVKAL